LTKLQSVAFHPVDETLIPDDIKTLPRPSRRIMEVLQKGSPASVSTAPKSWSLDFCLSPTSLNSNSPSDPQLSSVSFEKTFLSPSPFDPQARAIGTGTHIDLAASLAFRSIGYKSEALHGFTDLKIPFNDRTGTIPNDELGRIVDPVSTTTMPGLYCAGWVKRGPTGVIASTMSDAFSTAESITEDWYGHVPFLNGGKSSGFGWEGVRGEAENRGCRRVSWADWKKINAIEKSMGKSKGKEREKFTSVEDMLAVLD
jgi:adrenodoxin-NADP+ reductase